MSYLARQPLFRAAAAVALICLMALPVSSRRVRASAPHAGGGTLIVDFLVDLSHLDTGLCYDTECYPFMKVLYDRLVDYDTLHGAGNDLIPDAATSMPAITNG